MGFFSRVGGAVKGTVRTAAKVAIAPTLIAGKVASRVAPRPVSSLFGRALALTPTAIVARAALKMTNRRSSSAATPDPPEPTLMPAARRPRSVIRAIPRAVRAKPTGIMARVANAITNPSAAPSSGRTLTPAGVQAVAASVANPYGSAPTRSANSGGGDEGGGAESSSPRDDQDDGADPYGQGGDDAAPSAPASDPTADLPDGFLDPPPSDDADPYLSGIDYHAALAGLGDWKSDLKTFGATAGKGVASAALTTVANKLTGARATVPPPPPPGMSMGVKVAIGVALASAGYLVMTRTGRHQAAA